MADSSLEAKICVLGAQGVGKTSLVQRFVTGTFIKTLSTVGASFLTKRIIDVDSATIVRLQIWDTAGQERYRSISKLYYRGASAVVLVYSIIDENSFQEMGKWLQEIKQNCDEDIIIHIVGTKSDIVAEDPSQRQIPFERCIAYVAENLYPREASTPPPTASSPGLVHTSGDSKRNSGFWGMEVGWDVCHEISASSGEGIEEVFRVITRKLVENKQGKIAATPPAERVALTRRDTGGGYFDHPGSGDNGSFRVRHGDHKRPLSWLGSLTPTVGGEEEQYVTRGYHPESRGGRCC